MNERFTCSKINQIVTQSICELRIEKGFCDPDNCPLRKDKIENKEGNHLKPEKRLLVEKLISKGKGNRLIERETGVSKNTVKKVRQEIISETGEEPLCECGQPATHNGWCKYRYKNSPKRQETMRKLKDKKKTTISEHSIKPLPKQNKEEPKYLSFKELLLSKFPAFDPTWEDKIKTVWFDGFTKLLNIMNPQEKKNLPKFTEENS